MKVGEIYYHINTGMRMRVIKCDEPEVCTCEQIDEPKVYFVGLDKMDYPRAVCATVNLVKTLQPNLFS